MPSETSTCIEKGNEKLEQNEPAEAINYFDEALKLEPDNADAYFFKGSALIELEEDENALNCFNKVLELDPNYNAAYYNKSLVLFYLEDYEKAERCIDKFLELEPENIDALNLKGIILTNSGKKNMALGYFDDALKIDPNYFYALKNRGKTLFELGKHKEAITSLKIALNIVPDDEEVLIYIGFSLISLGKSSEGLAFYDKVLSLNNRHSGVMYLKACLFVDMDKEKEAMNCLNNALKFEPEYTDALILKAEIYRDMEKPEKALKCYEKASQIDPENPDPWVGMGNVFKDMGKKKEAVKSYEKFVEIIRKNKISDKYLEARRVMEYINWVKKGEPITFSPKQKPQYWQWSTKSEYFLGENGGERDVLEPQSSHDPGVYWTCHKDTLAGDLILLYRAGKANGVQYMDIKYLIMARSDAYPLDDINVAVEEGWDYGCDYIPLFKFENSLKLNEMREDPYLEGWNALGVLFHKKAYLTKEKYWKRLMDLLTKKNPEFTEFMKTFDRKKVIAQITTEKELEDNLEKNIRVLKKFGHDLEVVSRQKRCIGDEGRIDLLCKSNNADEYVVIELKINKANRDVFGQISGYLGWVMEHKSNGEPVKGIVISRGYDKKFQSAMKTNPNVEHIELVDVVSELGMTLK
ncbi:PDDEXK nuclease domain-containing protein [Methanobacterium paludis]|uniref:Tetratricopeptide TPR_2 repeat-containing protein n=1 Tax=Methanobacterium paludis (strain DSM 25820 / JCM 18151 / SWAN1) TaxID=868131 RepID=F6D6M0_METPW|nr:PDDEXK nuclease domain-containing protein [Methanobacterium paludis]AEG17733.1 Tetratricopeptide TPR_2 repeat-containing protein [Methanobacterium paludis]